MDFYERKYNRNFNKEIWIDELHRQAECPPKWRDIYESGCAFTGSLVLAGFWTFAANPAAKQSLDATIEGITSQNLVTANELIYAGLGLVVLKSYSSLKESIKKKYTIKIIP
jgi:hypothetical protein